MDPFITGSLISGGLSSLGSIYSNTKQQQLANKQMKFQKEMSSTAHQREVADLRKAGLNPILSAGGQGASAPSGAMANITNPLEGAGESMKSILQSKQLKQQDQSIQADIQAKKIQNAKTSQEIKMMREELKAMKQESVMRSKVANTKSTIADMADKTAGSAKQVYDFATKGQIGEALYDFNEWTKPIDKKWKGYLKKKYNQFRRFIGGQK